MLGHQTGRKRERVSHGSWADGARTPATSTVLRRTSDRQVERGIKGGRQAERVVWLGGERASYK